MTWFKVDDGFPNHPKLDGLKGARLVAAVAVWTYMGADCARLSSDGQFTRERLLSVCVRLGRITVRAADDLVCCKLWERTSAGYAFKNWAEYQPSKAEVEAKRAANAKRVARFRKAHADDVTPDGNGASNALHTHYSRVSNSPPSRPDPDPIKISDPPPTRSGAISARDPGQNGGGGRGPKAPPTPEEQGLDRWEPDTADGSPEFTQARMCAVFTREWWGSRNAPPNLHTRDPMTGRRLHADVCETAMRRGEDPESLFERVLREWLPTAPDDAAVFPFAYFAARFGKLLAVSPKQAQEAATKALREDLARQLQLVRGGNHASG